MVNYEVNSKELMSHMSECNPELYLHVWENTDYYKYDDITRSLYLRLLNNNSYVNVVEYIFNKYLHLMNDSVTKYITNRPDSSDKRIAWEEVLIWVEKINVFLCDIAEHENYELLCVFLDKIINDISDKETLISLKTILYGEVCEESCLYSDGYIISDTTQKRLFNLLSISRETEKIDKELYYNIWRILFSIKKEKYKMQLSAIHRQFLEIDNCRDNILQNKEVRVIGASSFLKLVINSTYDITFDKDVYLAFISKTFGIKLIKNDIEDTEISYTDDFYERYRLIIDRRFATVPYLISDDERLLAEQDSDLFYLNEFKYLANEGVGFLDVYNPKYDIEHVKTITQSHVDDSKKRVEMVKKIL